MVIDPQIDRVFVDSSYVIAACNLRDQHHEKTKAIDHVVAGAAEIWTTDAVLLEVCASLASPSIRDVAVRLWDRFHGGDPRCRVVEATRENLLDAMKLFRNRPDKEWSLTDCFSFRVMEREGLSDALTADQHFEQAGFRALLF